MTNLPNYRIITKHDDDADLSYLDCGIEDFDTWVVKKDWFRSLRPETRRYQGQRFKLVDTPGGPYRRVGQYYVAEFPLSGHRRLVLPEEVLMDLEEYQDTHGDPNNYSSYGAILQKTCPCCGQWQDIDAIWGLDYYEYGEDKEPYPNTYTVEDAFEDFDLIKYHFEHHFDEVDGVLVAREERGGHEDGTDLGV